MQTRRYTLRQRAERQEETRARIVAAVVALHREVGPARTTISAIAERAGVERLTVYRHFADETALLTACSAQWSAEVPPPEPTWLGEPDPGVRLRLALLAFYDYYRRGEDMLAHVTRDASQMPALGALLQPWLEFVAMTRTSLMAGWGARGRRRERVEATIAHALQFDTWRSLARAGALRDDEVADLMVALVRAARGDTA